MALQVSMNSTPKGQDKRSKEQTRRKSLSFSIRAITESEQAFRATRFLQWALSVPVLVSFEA